MQTQKEIQALLEQVGSSPQKRFGQCFLIDRHLMDKVLDTADLQGGETVLEVGPGTGSLTEELIARVRRVVAVEIDRNLAALLYGRLASVENFTLIEADVLAAKSCISPDVLTAVAPGAHLVSNLPYSIATSLIAECMVESWQSLHGRGVRFDRLTFTVQNEVAERMAARSGPDYGKVSVILSLLGRVTLGAHVPATAFWPRPKVASRIVRVDFDPNAAEALHDIRTLQTLLHMTFTQRRKYIAKTVHARGAPFDAEVFQQAIATAGLDPTCRVDCIRPEGFRDLANALSAAGATSD